MIGEYVIRGLNFLVYQLKLILKYILKFIPFIPKILAVALYPVNIIYFINK